MKRYKYTETVVTRGMDHTLHMNRMAAAGWRLVAVTNGGLAERLYWERRTKKKGKKG